LATQEKHKVSLDDFALAFGTNASTFSEDNKAIVAERNFRYQKLTGRERDQVILEIIQRLDSGQFTVAGEDQKEIWEMAWNANFERLKKVNFKPQELVPDFIRSNQIIRLNQEYILPDDPQFELNFSMVFRCWLFESYLNEVDNIFDFGCGSGLNISYLCDIFPEKNLYGLDWAASAVDIINQLGSRLNNEIKGFRFNFFEPDYQLDIKKNSAFLTWGALEQIGDRYEPFLDFIFKKSPDLCINVEPIDAWYDEDILVDYLALNYHRKRGYLSGYISRLEELDSQGKIQIIASKRLMFGSKFHEVYSFVIWKPLRTKI
jgi:hypothetical protein